MNPYRNSRRNLRKSNTRWLKRHNNMIYKSNFWINPWMMINSDLCKKGLIKKKMKSEKLNWLIRNKFNLLSMMIIWIWVNPRILNRMRFRIKENKKIWKLLKNFIKMKKTNPILIKMNLWIQILMKIWVCSEKKVLFEFIYVLLLKK